MARMLLTAKADVGAKEHRGMTALHRAAANGHKEVVGVLLDAGADIATSNDANGRTPLHCAVMHGRMGVAELLLDARADVSAKDASGCTPLHCVASVKGREAARFATWAHQEVASASTVTSTLNERLARLLLDAGADVVAKDRGQKTPLHCAARLGQVQRPDR